MGMALDESTDGLVELTSNGITTYIDPKLNEYLSRLGDISIDYITNEMGSGYSIVVGDGACGSGNCGGCSGAS
jgi:Fe-S cluster assembly iron-binding protein IscA